MRFIDYGAYVLAIGTSNLKKGRERKGKKGGKGEKKEERN
jgi:hypothetical protein